MALHAVVETGERACPKKSDMELTPIPEALTVPAAHVRKGAPRNARWTVSFYGSISPGDLGMADRPKGP